MMHGSRGPSLLSFAAVALVFSGCNESNQAPGNHHASTTSTTDASHATDGSNVADGRIDVDSHWRRQHDDARARRLLHDPLRQGR